MAPADLPRTRAASPVPRQGDRGWSRLFGYDIFISFALGLPPRGARGYASDLARRLRERGFTVFFSEDEASAGGELDQTLKRALRASRVLVVVANRGTLREPRWVRSEVEEFRRRHPRRAIVPISIDGALRDPELGAATEAWLPFAKRIWIDESREAGESGIVGDEVIDRLVTAPHAVRSAVRLRASVSAALAFLALLAAIALWQKHSADANAEEANVQRGKAELQARRADASASEARAAASAAEAARNQEREARAAETLQRQAAEERQRIAQSRELAVSATAQLSADPERSVLLARAGVELSPTLESESALRAALLEPRGRRIVDRTLGSLWGVAYSPDGRRLVSIGDEGMSVSESATGVVDSTVRVHGLRTVVIGADGRYAVSTDEAGTARIWRLSGGRASAWIPGRPSGVRLRATLSPDSRLVATFGEDPCARLWALATGAELGALCGPRGATRSVAFSPDGTRLISGGEDGIVRVWDVATGQLLRELDSSPQPVGRVAFSPDGRLAATIAAGVSSVRLWDTRSWKLSATVDPDYSVVDAVFSPDGESMAIVASLGSDVQVFNTRDGKERARLAGHTGRIFSVAFSPRGDLLVTASEDKTVRVWSLARGSAIATVRGHQDIVTTARFSPDGMRIATSSLDGTSRIWEFAEFTGVTEMGGPLVERVGLGAGGDVAWLLTSYGQLALWSLAGAESRPILRPAGKFSAAALSRDGRTLATADSDGFLRLRRVPGGDPVAAWPRPDGAVRRIEFSPDGTRLLSQGDSVVLWDLRSRTAVATLEAPDPQKVADAFSPDGQLVVTFGIGSAILWNGRSGKRVATLPATPAYGVTFAGFSPDGRQVVTTGVDKIVRVWRTAGPGAPRELAGHTGSVTGAWFSPDGQSLVSVGQDQTARIWDIASGQMRTELRGNWDAASFSPNGALVLTTGWHKPATVWDARTGALLIEFDAQASAAMFSRDGGQVMAVVDGTLRLHPCPECGGVGALLQLARTRATRALNADERRTFLHEMSPPRAKPGPP